MIRKSELRDNNTGGHLMGPDQAITPDNWYSEEMISSRNLSGMGARFLPRIKKQSHLST